MSEKMDAEHWWSGGLNYISDKAKGISDKVEISYDNFQEYQKPTSEDNWLERTANGFDALADAIMCDAGWTNRGVKFATAKMAGIAVPASIFSLASIVGTASTGTAIGTLNGAAFTSSALAWVGGSVAAGGLIVAGLTVVGAFAAPILAKPYLDKYLLGEARTLDDLDDKQRNLVNACFNLSLAIRKKNASGGDRDSRDILTIHSTVLPVIIEKASNLYPEISALPLNARRKFDAAILSLLKLRGYAHVFSQHLKIQKVSFASLLVLKLMSENQPIFTENEQIILDAMRRSNKSLSDMTNDEIGAYVQGLEPAQLNGFKSNVKGIAHELQFMSEENSDGDEYHVEMFEHTNNAGADIRMINVETGEVVDYQLKATSFEGYVLGELSRNPHVDFIVTDEVAQSGGWNSSGINDASLSDDFDSTIQKIAPYMPFDGDEVLAFTALAALSARLAGSLADDKDVQDRSLKHNKRYEHIGMVAGLSALIL